jgi:hypothetical protein
MQIHISTPFPGSLGTVLNIYLKVIKVNLTLRRYEVMQGRVRIASLVLKQGKKSFTPKSFNTRLKGAWYAFDRRLGRLQCRSGLSWFRDT